MNVHVKLLRRFLWLMFFIVYLEHSIIALLAEINVKFARYRIAFGRYCFGIIDTAATLSKQMYFFETIVTSKNGWKVEVNDSHWSSFPLLQLVKITVRAVQISSVRLKTSQFTWCSMIFIINAHRTVQMYIFDFLVGWKVFILDWHLLCVLWQSLYRLYQLTWICFIKIQ